jgi:hypothetical protein
MSCSRAHVPGDIWVRPSRAMCKDVIDPGPRATRWRFLSRPRELLAELFASSHEAQEEEADTLASVFRQSVPRLALSIEMGTDSVPDDGRYHVLLDGKRVYASAQKNLALSKYRDLREELAGAPQTPTPDSMRLLDKLRADVDIRAVQSASSQAKRANATHRRRGGTRWKST